MTVRVLATLGTGTWAIILYNQVTLKTSPSARYCALFKARDCWMLRQRVAQKFGNGLGARVTLLDILFFFNPFTILPRIIVCSTELLSVKS